MRFLWFCQALVLFATLNEGKHLFNKKATYRRPLNRLKQSMSYPYHRNTPKPKVPQLLLSKGEKKGPGCLYPNGILPDPIDVYSYKICIARGGNWIIYSYHCPQRTYFNEMAERCVSGSPPTTTKMPTTAAIATTVPTTVLTASSPTTETWRLSTSTQSDTASTEMSASESTNTQANTNTTPLPSTLATEFDTTTLPTTVTTDPSSSSSEEEETIFLTLPPHFTSRPLPPPPLITGQLSIPSFAGIHLKDPYTTVRTMHEFPSKDVTTQKPVTPSNKLTTWQSLNMFSTFPTVSKATMMPTREPIMDRNTTVREKLKNPLEFVNSLDKFDVKLVQNLIAEADQQATRRPTRWKPHIIASSFPARERFPGLRPSSLQTN